MRALPDTDGCEGVPVQLYVKAAIGDVILYSAGQNPYRKRERERESRKYSYARRRSVCFKNKYLIVTIVERKKNKMYIQQIRNFIEHIKNSILL